MGTRTSYAPGTFSWVDLSTTDPEAAKAFYSELFGWTYDDMPAGDEGGVYSMAQLGGDPVCALAELPPGDPGPPRWNSYVTVESADAAAARAGELGGEAVLEPFDVLDVGRMAVLRDAVGAFFMVWEPRRHIGAARVNEVGCLTWNELGTPDVEAATPFYVQLFGWATEPMDTGGGPAYTIVKVGERSNGGIREQGPQEKEGGVPPNWMPYFAVESADATAARAGELGANALMPPTDIPSGGRIAAIADPQGAAFAIWEGPLDD
jgi:predicted enzyme related to lactoylglutathione lyase